MASLGQDLAYIREKKNLSLEDIHGASRIPVETLQSIEDNSLFSDIKVNNTFKRSFVRSYARVLKIEDKKVVTALNKLEEGRYSSFLDAEQQKELYGAEAIKPKKQVEKPKENPKKPSLEKVKKEEPKQVEQPKPKVEEKKEPQQTPVKPKAEEEKKKVTTETQIKNSDVPPVPKVDLNVKEETPPEPITARKLVNKSPNEPGVSNVNWSDVSKTRAKQTPSSSNTGAIVVAVLIILAIVFYLSWEFLGLKDMMMGQGTTQEQLENTTSNEVERQEVPAVTDLGQTDDLSNQAEESDDTVTDTPVEEPVTDESNAIPVDADDTPAVDTDNSDAQTEVDAEAVEEEETTTEEDNTAVEGNTDPFHFIDPSATSLPQTLEVLVYAATDNLAPVRLRWDDISSLRPYWIEVSQAMSVKFDNELRLRTLNYDNMVLLFNGHIVPDVYNEFYNEEEGLLVIPRSYFEQNPSKWTSNSMEGFNSSGLELPSKVNERPKF